MSSGLPLFWRVKIERMGVDMRAAQRQHGLEQFFGGGPGGVALADVMGDGAPIATPFEDSEITVLICENCATEPTFIAALAEKG